MAERVRVHVASLREWRRRARRWSDLPGAPTRCPTLPLDASVVCSIAHRVAPHCAGQRPAATASAVDRRTGDGLHPNAGRALMRWLNCGSRLQATAEYGSARTRCSGLRTVAILAVRCRAGRGPAQFGRSRRRSDPMTKEVLIDKSRAVGNDCPRCAAPPRTQERSPRGGGGRADSVRAGASESGGARAGAGSQPRTAEGCAVPGRRARDGTLAAQASGGAAAANGGADAPVRLSRRTDRAPEPPPADGPVQPGGCVWQYEGIGASRCCSST